MNLFQMKIKIILGLAVSVLITSCAVNSSKLQKQITERLNENKKNDTLSYKIKSNNIIELKLNQDISLTTNCKQIKSSFIPAIFYWGWNSEVICELSKENIENQLKKDLIVKIEKEGLQTYFEDKKLQLTIDEIPTQFKFQDKGDVIYLVFGYIMSQKRYFAPELKRFKGSYQILDKENKVLVAGGFTEPLALKSQTSIVKSTKKLSWQYLDNYNLEINRFVSVVLTDLKTKIKQ